MFSHLCKRLALFDFALHRRGSSHVRTMMHPHGLPQDQTQCGQVERAEILEVCFLDLVLWISSFTSLLGMRYYISQRPCFFGSGKVVSPTCPAHC